MQPDHVPIVEPKGEIREEALRGSGEASFSALSWYASPANR